MFFCLECSRRQVCSRAREKSLGQTEQGEIDGVAIGSNCGVENNNGPRGSLRTTRENDH
jgi:hypothetical protein